MTFDAIHVYCNLQHAGSGVLDVMLVYSLMTLYIFVSNYNGHIETRSNIWKYPGPDGESQSCLVWVSGNQLLFNYKLLSILEGEI